MIRMDSIGSALFASVVAISAQAILGAPGPASSPAQGMAPQAQAAGALHEQVNRPNPVPSLARRRVVTTDSSATDVSRRIVALETRLNELEASLDSLARAGTPGDPPTDEAWHGGQRADDVLADEIYDAEQAMAIVADEHDAFLTAEAPSYDTRESITERVQDASAEGLLGDAAFRDASCSAWRCRLEFAHTDDADGGDLATNLGLVLPHGASSSFVPLYDGHDVVGTLVYVEFGTS